jgi:signal transduction histidine kinase/ligand-binding sensor domain-containing protein/CheY-like chemotaxis protein/AraC-like DNA-binding protein
MKIKFLLLFLSSVFYLGIGYAQDNEFQFSRLDINNGLSHNQVTCIFKDNKGFMWFGTLSGLNRYDGYKFKVFKHASADTSSINDDFIVNIFGGPDNKLWIETRNGINIYDPLTEKFDHRPGTYLRSIGISKDSVTAVKKDNAGNFWFLINHGGVYRYSALNHKLVHLIHRAGDTTSIAYNSASDLGFDSKGNTWLVYNNGTIEQLNGHTFKVSYRNRTLCPPVPTSPLNYKIFVDRQDDVWAFISAYSSGIYYLSRSKNTHRHLDKDSRSLNVNIVYNVIQDEQNRIWVATDHGGINLIDKSNFTVRYITSRDDDTKSLSQNSTISMYYDNSGIVWIGTYKRGISYYHRSIIKFPLYTHHSSDPNSLSYNDINMFVEDKAGNLWLGTNGGGLIYFNRKTGKYTTYRHTPANVNSLTNDVIVCLYIDHEQKLWIGTYFGGLDCYDGKTFTHYRHSDAVPGSVSDNRICAIKEDSQHNLWVGTMAGGLNLFQPATKTFYHYQSIGGPNTIHSNYISALLEDRHKNLWIVTSYGVDVMLHQTHKFVHYIHSDNDPNSLVNNNTNNIHEDNRGFIWISTREGISIYNPQLGKFQNLTREDGLPDNTVLDIEEDDSHNMWVSTTNGLSNIIVNRNSWPLKFSFLNYTETDGLQGREFTENASCKTSRGELVFGGANGFNIFKPVDIRINHAVPTIVFSDFSLFNKLINAGDNVNGHIVLNESVNNLKKLELRYNENAFSIGFAALDYFNPDKVKYEYMMEGFDKGWISADNKIRQATYTNLDPGNYTFKVRASSDNHWSNTNALKLQIQVLPPFWRTPLAYLLYAVALVLFIFYIRKRGIDKLKLEFALEKEREEVQRMHDLDLMKIKFFTNVSHEFRTPLSLILAPVDKILKQITEPEIQRQLMVVNRNARRLLNLVNQLLDFRKMEYQELKLHEEDGDVIHFVKELCYSFTDVAEQKHVGFIFDATTDELYTRFDHDKVERMMFNLLSNAYKFTPAGGQVSVMIAIKKLEGDLRELEIEVTDTGIGIEKDKLEKIFEPFFQNDLPGSMLNQGSGIGLSIVKEFVRLHGGEISVQSEPGMGSCFTLKLQVQELEKALVAEQTTFEEVPATLYIPELMQPEVDTRPDRKKPTILLVEDNDDFRFYIKDNLRESFNVIEAENGRKGWQKALSQHPNLVVSDISMPEMTGIELCVKIRNDKRTAHIPVILLTALTGEEQQLKGLETGATDYMTKPFNFDILQSKIRNILSQQEDMRKTYQKQVDVKPTELKVESPDELFIKKVLALIETNISNPNFSVEELSGEMCVSRYTLYKKILMMTGKTPNELVRSMRLKRAAQLLETGHLTISQICSKVGFKSQKYFVKSFKAEFNTIPSKYAAQFSAEVMQD